MSGSTSPEQPNLRERRFEQHKIALEKIVRPDHIQANQTIYEQLRSGEITFDEAQRKHEELLIEVASIDHMTGLDNIRAAEIKLAQLIEYCAGKKIPLVGMYIDGDDFRTINEMGHHVGNQVIRALGQTLETTRTTDLPTRLSDETDSIQLPENEKPDTQSRLGGDEFFIALPGVTLQDASTIFSRIMTEFIAITDRDIPEYRQKFGRPITITAGAAQYDQDQDLNPQGFIKKCERKMQSGKETGKGLLII